MNSVLQLERAIAPQPHAERLNDVSITPDPPTEAPEHGVPRLTFPPSRDVRRTVPPYAGAAGAVVAGAAVASAGAGGHSAELDYTGPELAHSAELDYQGADDLPELLPREAAQAPAPRGFARPGDLSAGGGVV